MNNEIAKSEPIKLNAEGNQIVSEFIDGAGKTQTIKYGLIKLLGEKQERRVSLKTLLAINKASEEEAQSVMIKELNMAVKLNQIVMMRSETENVRIEDNITSLPTANICLDLDFNISQHIRPYFMRNNIPYYEAVAHYVERDGTRQYYLEVDKIKRLIKIDFDANGYDYVSEIYHYGVKQ